MPTPVSLRATHLLFVATCLFGLTLHEALGAAPVVAPQPLLAVETYPVAIAAQLPAATAYQWQQSEDDGVTWTAVDTVTFPTADEATLVIPQVSSDMDTLQFRCLRTLSDEVSTSTPVLLLVEPALAVQTVAGPIPGSSVDGAGAAARFSTPVGLVHDADGNTYVTDMREHTVRKITPAGVVTTLAGLAGQPGYVNGTGSAARFNSPAGITLAADGHLIVADSQNAALRRVSLDGVVTTFAGRHEDPNFPNLGGSFLLPTYVTADPTGNIYVGDIGILLKVAPNGLVQPLAGTTAYSPQSLDGTGSDARFWLFAGPLTFDPSSGNLFVSDQGGAIRRVTPAGVVTTIAGSLSESGFADGVGLNARFGGASSLGADGAGNIYISDGANSVVRRMTPDLTVTTIAGTTAPSRSLPAMDGTGLAAQFHSLGSMAVGTDGSLTVVDRTAIRRINAAREVTTLAGTKTTSRDGTGASAVFGSASDVTSDADGNIYIVDLTDHTVRKMTPDGVVTTLAGAAGIAGYVDGSAAAARFRNPSVIAYAGNGDLIVGDNGNHCLRRITPSGQVTTITGDPDTAGSSDGTLDEATFNQFFAIATNEAGDIFVAASGRVRRISVDDDQVTTLAIMNVDGIAVDADGDLIITHGNVVSRMSPHDGFKYTIAGVDGEAGTIDGPRGIARLTDPQGVVVDDFGNIYVTDENRIRRISTDGTITTLLGTPDVSSILDGVGSAVHAGGWGLPLTIASDGHIYLATGGSIRRASQAVRIASQTPDAAATAGQEIELSAHGVSTGAASYRWQLRRSGEAVFEDIPGAVTSTLTLGAAQPFHAGTYRVFVSAAGQTVSSAPMEVTVEAAAPNNARLLNLSTRARALTGDNILIPGFVVSGTGAKRLLIRAVGPTLKNPPYNIASALENPRMLLKRLDTSVIPSVYVDVGANDDWMENDNAVDIDDMIEDLSAFAFEDDREAALLVDLSPGQYTVFADGVNAATGVAIVELYDADSDSPGARLANISNRGFVGTGEAVMIPGFVISSEGPKTLLVRVVGPTLAGAPYNVPGTLADPKLEIFPSGSGTSILSQDNWSDNPDADHTAEIAADLGAFALAEGSADAAFVVTLPPGGYTVVGSAADGTSTGVVLVEVYVLP